MSRRVRGSVDRLVKQFIHSEGASPVHHHAPNATRVALAIISSASIAASLPAGILVFDGFADTSLLTINGDAETVTTADGVVLRLTAATGNEGGSSFATKPVDATSFTSHFRFRITEPGGGLFDCNTETGADRLVFVVQSVSAGVGGVGQGIGYAGIPKSAGVEFDTWCNAGNNDPSSNHVGIDINGSVNHGAGAPFTADVATKLDNGQLWYAWVSYDGATLRAYLNDEPVQPFQPIVEREMDLPAILQQPTAFVGFTSATGAAWGNHDIVYWEYTPFTDVCFGDFNGDGTIDGTDLGILLSNWGSNLLNFDLNGDDLVDGTDVGVLLSNWGDCPSAS